MFRAGVAHPFIRHGRTKRTWCTEVAPNNPSLDPQPQDQELLLADRHDCRLKGRLKKIVLFRGAARRCEPRNVSAHLRRPLQMFERLAQNACCPFVLRCDQSIVHPLAFASRRNAKENMLFTFFQSTPVRMKNGRKSSRSFKDGSDFLRTIAPYQ